MTSRTRRIAALTAATAGLLFLSGCATQPELTGPDVPGFWMGMFHGVTAPFALVASFFGEVRMYAFPNSGPIYDLGYAAGLILWAGLATALAD